MTAGAAAPGTTPPLTGGITLLKWGWHRVAQNRNPLPASPLFDVLIKQLPYPGTSS